MAAGAAAAAVAFVDLKVSLVDELFDHFVEGGLGRATSGANGLGQNDTSASGVDLCFFPTGMYHLYVKKANKIVLFNSIQCHFNSKLLSEKTNISTST